MMNSNLEPTAPTAADTPAPAPASVAGQHVAALLSTSALPATTVQLAAMTPKFPPFVGD
jgi:hypothetical protein